MTASATGWPVTRLARPGRTDPGPAAARQSTAVHRVRLSAAVLVAGALSCGPSPGPASPDGTPLGATPVQATPTATPAQPTPDDSAAPTPSSEPVEVGAFLPPSHEELARVHVPRPDRPDALLVVSAPQQDEPRPVLATLLEWDDGGLTRAEAVEIGCDFLVSLERDDDGGVTYLHCTAGATAHDLLALEPRPSQIVRHPRDPTDPDRIPMWWHESWSREPVAGAPDTLLVGQNTCKPSCMDENHTTYRLVWAADLKSWAGVSCELPDGQTIQIDPPLNASLHPDLNLDVCEWSVAQAAT